METLRTSEYFPLHRVASNHAWIRLRLEVSLCKHYETNERLWMFVGMSCRSTGEAPRTGEAIETAVTSVVQR